MDKCCQTIYFVDQEKPKNKKRQEVKEEVDKALESARAEQVYLRPDEYISAIEKEIKKFEKENDELPVDKRA